MNAHEYKLIQQIFTMSEESLLRTLPKVLRKFYKKENLRYSDQFIYAQGLIPITLVAHLDTVHKRLPQPLFHDPKEKVLFSPNGLGADDRAGVFAILSLLEKGYLPSIIFCAQEERGGIGAISFTKKFSKPATPTNFLIELDRQGYTDSVYYDLNNPKFEEYINQYGFHTEFGTFSDISIIAPAWKLPAVNLSIGYFNEHTLGEYLKYEFMFETISKVEKILDAETNANHTFEYIEDTAYRWNSFVSIAKDNVNYCCCSSCNDTYPEEIMLPVKEYDYTFFICPNCINDNVSWCSKCGEPFLNEPDNPRTLCHNCKEELRDELNGKTKCSD